VYLDALGQGALPRDAASDIFDTLVALLRTGGRIIVVTAVIVALIVFLSGLPLRRYAVSGWSSVANSPRRRWVSLHRQALMIAVGVLAMIALLAADPLTGGFVLLVLVLAGAAIALIAALGAGAQEGDGDVAASSSAAVDAGPPQPGPA
jgi:hypothetical protein